MEFFECCHHCPSTKRHPGCHGDCPDYAAENARWTEHKETVRQARLEEYLEPPTKNRFTY